MFVNNEHNSNIIPDDGLISDIEQEMQLYSTDILDELLDERKYHPIIIAIPTLANK